MFKKTLTNKRGAALMNVLVLMLVLSSVGSLFLGLSFYFLKESKAKAVSLSYEYEVKTISESLIATVMDGTEVEIYTGRPTSLLTALNEIRAGIVNTVPTIDANDTRPYEERLEEALDGNINLTGLIDGDKNKFYTLTMSTDGLSITIKVTIVKNGIVTNLVSRVKVMPDGWDNDQFKENMERIYKTAATTYVYTESNLCDGWIDADGDGSKDDECGFCYSYRRYNGSHLTHNQIPRHLHVRATRDGGTVAKPQDPICISLAPQEGLTDVTGGADISEVEDIKFFRPADINGNLLTEYESNGVYGFKYANGSIYTGALSDVQYIVDKTVFGVGINAGNDPHFNEGAYIALDYPSTLDGAADDGIFADIIINGSCQVYQGNIKGGDYANTYYGYGNNDDSSKDGPVAGSPDLNFYANGDCVLFGVNVGNYAYINGNFAAIDNYMNGDHLENWNYNSDLTRVNGSMYLGTFSDYNDYRNASTAYSHGTIHGNFVVQNHLFIEGVQITDERYNTFNRYVGGDAKILGTYVNRFKANGNTLELNTVPGAAAANTDGDAFKMDGLVMQGGFNVQGDLHSENVRWYSEWDGRPIWNTNQQGNAIKVQNNFTINVGGDAEFINSHLMARKLKVVGNLEAEGTGFEFIMWQIKYQEGILGTNVTAEGNWYSRAEMTVEVGGDIQITAPPTLRFSHMFCGGNIIIDFTGSPRVTVGYGNDWEEERRAMVRPVGNDADTTPGIQAKGDILILGQIDTIYNAFYIEMGAVAGGSFIVSGDASILSEYNGRKNYKTWIETKVNNDSTNPVKLAKNNGLTSVSVGGVACSTGYNVGFVAQNDLVFYQYQSANIGNLTAKKGDIMIAASIGRATYGYGKGGQHYNESTATDIKTVEAKSDISGKGGFYVNYARINTKNKVVVRTLDFRNFQVGSIVDEGNGGFRWGIDCETFYWDNNKCSDVIYDGAGQLYPRLGNTNVTKGQMTIKNSFVCSGDYANTVIRVHEQNINGDDGYLLISNVTNNDGWHYANPMIVDGDIRFENDDSVVTRAPVYLRSLNATRDIKFKNTHAIFVLNSAVNAGRNFIFEGNSANSYTLSDFDDGNASARVSIRVKGNTTIKWASTGATTGASFTHTSRRLQTFVTLGNMVLENTTDFSFVALGCGGNVVWKNHLSDILANTRNVTMQIKGSFTLDNSEAGNRYNTNVNEGVYNASVLNVRKLLAGGDITVKNAGFNWHSSDGSGGNYHAAIFSGGNIVFDNSCRTDPVNFYKYSGMYAHGSIKLINIKFTTTNRVNSGTGLFWKWAAFLFLQNNADGIFMKDITSGSGLTPGHNETDVLKSESGGTYYSRYLAKGSNDGYIRAITWPRADELNGDWEAQFNTLKWNDFLLEGGSDKGTEDIRLAIPNYSWTITVAAVGSKPTIATDSSGANLTGFTTQSLRNNFSWNDTMHGYGGSSPYLDDKGNVIRDASIINAAYSNVKEFQDFYTRNADTAAITGSKLSDSDNTDSYDDGYSRFMASNLYVNASLDYFRDTTDYFVKSKLYVVLEWLKPTESVVAGIDNTLAIDEQGNVIYDAGQKRNEGNLGTNYSGRTFYNQGNNITLSTSGTFPWKNAYNHNEAWYFAAGDGASVRFDATNSDLHIVIPKGMTWNISSGVHFEVIGSNRVFIYMQDGFTLNASAKSATAHTLIGARREGSSNNKVYMSYNNRAIGSIGAVLPDTNIWNNSKKAVQLFFIGVKGANNINLTFDTVVTDAYIYMPYSKNSSVIIKNNSTDEYREIFGLSGGVVASNIQLLGIAAGIRSDVPIDLSGLDFSIITGMPIGSGNNDTSFNGVQVKWEFEGYLG